MRDLKWSPSEKIIARKAFDQALTAELRDVVQRAKQIAAAVEEPSELWELETWLRQCRLEIDRKYDYRYSVLPMVFWDSSEARPHQRKGFARSPGGKDRPDRRHCLTVMKIVAE
jgi:Photoprotection regulator fluorescence recovery protein